MTFVPVWMAFAALTLQAGAQPEGCRVIEPTKAQRHTVFRNAIVLEGFAMRTLSGESWCNGLPFGEVSCAAIDPQLVHVTVNGRHFWFKVAAGRSAIIDVDGPVPKCVLN